MILKRCVCLCLAVLLCLTFLLPASAQQPPSRLYFVSRTMPTGELLQTLQLCQSEFAAEGFELSLAYGPAELVRRNDLALEFLPSLGAEGYRIEKGRIFYADADGLFYGLRSYLKMRKSGRISVLTEVPLVKERVLMLDCARKYFSKDFICNLIAQMSWIGYNTLELHLTEEQGIRADIWDEDYFESENDYSWICGSRTASWVYDCPDPDAGRFLTAAELVEILKAAEKYHIDIIPSFNTPGHSEYLCKVFQENAPHSFTYEGRSYTASSIRSGQYSLIDFTDPVTKAFVHSVMTDYAKFFARYGCDRFNICADEVSLPSTVCYDDFVRYVNETAEVLQTMGYRVRAFNDFLCYSDASVPLNKDIDIVYWHTPYPVAAATAQTFLEQGRTVYNAVQNYCYYALRVFNTPGYSDRPSWGLDARDEENVWWSFSRATAERVYAEWEPSKLYEYTDHEKTVCNGEQLGGAYFLIWCDYAGLASEEEIWSGKYPLLERLWAHGTKCTKSNLLPYDEFTEQIAAYYEFPGFTGCSEAISLPKTCNIAYDGGLFSVTQIEKFRHSELPSGFEAYLAFLIDHQVPYGPFGRKITLTFS